MGSYFDFLRNNFWHVMPILVSAVVGIAIILERARALYQVYPLKNNEEFFERVTDLVMAGRLGEAIGLCERYPSKPAAKVAKQAMLRAHQPENLIADAIE